MGKKDIIISDRFPKYTKYNPKVPVYCVTPKEGRVLHRFFDTSPFSPSGRYIALFRLPFEDRLNKPGDVGEIVLVDLRLGSEKVVATSRGFETQMGANINWGIDDNHLIYNDVDTDTWEVFGVNLNPHTGEKFTFPHGVYHVSPDGLYASTGNPTCKYKTQPGYGVIIPRDKVPVINILSKGDGLFITNTKTAESELLLSMKHIFETCFDREYIDKHSDGECYLFHSKYSPSGNKIMFSTRYIPKKFLGKPNPNSRNELKFNVFTCECDGSNLQVSVGQEHWENGGHHTTFHPNEKFLTMNIKKDFKKMRFAMASLDGQQIFKVFDTDSKTMHPLSTLIDRDVIGSGHPTFHPNGKFILTDTYTYESSAYGDGTIPIRMVSLKDGSEKTIVRINTDIEYNKDSTLRIDPHPAWDRTNRYVAINAVTGGTRRVYVLDMVNWI